MLFVFLEIKPTTTTTTTRCRYSSVVMTPVKYECGSTATKAEMCRAFKEIAFLHIDKEIERKIEQVTVGNQLAEQILLPV